MSIDINMLEADSDSADDLENLGTVIDRYKLPEPPHFLLVV